MAKDKFAARLDANQNKYDKYNVYVKRAVLTYEGCLLIKDRRLSLLRIEFFPEF